MRCRTKTGYPFRNFVFYVLILKRHAKTTVWCLFAPELIPLLQKEVCKSFAKVSKIIRTNVRTGKIILKISSFMILIKFNGFEGQRRVFLI